MTVQTRFEGPKAPPAAEADRRPRVLLLAEACNPAWLSIPLEGWSMYAALREVADVHLVTQVRNRADLIAAGLTEGRDFIAIDSERVAGPVYKAAVLLRGGRAVGWTTQMALSAISYPYFERLVWRRFGCEVEAGQWDVVHRLTPVSPTLPSPMAVKVERAGVPFVLGPLNGGIPWPAGWNLARLREREWLSFARGAYRLLPGYRSTLRSAAAVVCGSGHTLSSLPPWARGKARYIPENAIDPARFDRVRTPRDAGPLRVVFVGRLVPYKAPDVLLEAAAPLCARGEVELTIVGDGPMMGELKQRARALGLGNVRMPGHVPHTLLKELLAGMDVFAFPSVREFGGAVVVEAMATGLVPVVVDYGGPGEMVTWETGVKVPVGGRAELTRRFRDALASLVRDRARLEAMSPKARDRATTVFTWPAKAREMLDVYCQVIRSRT